MCDPQNQNKMTKEQFKKNFKVGDLITCSEWGESKTKIVYIGKEEFAGDDQGLNNGQEDGVDSHFMDARDWELWEEPVKKDLEGLKKWYKLYYDINDEVADVSLVWRKIRPTDVKRDDDRYMVMYIKEQEAIERGLKI